MELVEPTVEALSTSKTLIKQQISSQLTDRFFARWKNDPKFKWVLIGGALYACVQFSSFDFFALWPIRKFFQFFYNKYTVPESLLLWQGEVEPEVSFGRLGYTRCLESDTDVLEKFGVPMNAKKCLRDGIQFIPGEFYPEFDLSEFDPKETPLAWTYSPIQDPGIIMPIGWYNDMSGENMEYELFRRYMRVFGYLPPECYEELFQYCKIRLLQTNQHLFKIGDSDDKTYIIVKGAIDVYSHRIGPHNNFIRLRTATHGGHIDSLFSIMDLLSGNARNIRSLYAVSKLNTTKVLIFPISALKDYLVRNPEYLYSTVLRMLERSYRLQYQIMHLAFHLTTVISNQDPDPINDPPNVEIPDPETRVSDLIRDKAIQSFAKFLNFNDTNFLWDHCRVVVVEPESPTADLETIRASILNDATSTYKYIYVGKVEEFFLKSNLNPLDQKSRRKIVEEKMVPETLTTFSAGDGIGSLTGILGYKYRDLMFSRCVERSIVVTVDHNTLKTILERSPMSILPMAYQTVYRMSPFIRAVDFAMEWQHAEEGHYIYHKEQMCYDSYLIIAGRARAYQLDSESEHRAILEYKENDWMGVIESLLQSKRREKTCVVIRDTEFVKIPNDLLRNIVINYPEAAQVMLHFLIRRHLKSRKLELYKHESEKTGEDSYRESRRVHSLALIPASEALPYSVLAVEIKKHYLKSGTCVILTYKKILEKLRKADITPKEQFLLEMLILQEMEENDLVIFVCLTETHYWNTFCVTHSEVVFTIGCSQLPNISTVPPDYEEEVIGKKITTRRKELIILHKMDTVLPTNTKEWLFCRDWIHFHHHIRLPHSAFELLGAISEEEIEEVYPDLKREITINTDMSRLIRWIQGKCFGVLFSSGGSRIGAQLGMLQALTEYKEIPIDMVVGTGAGFLLAAVYAIYQDYKHVQNVVEKIFQDSNELGKFHWDDWTFPYINSGRGKRLLTYFYQLFGPVQLEDTWIPLCSVTTNLTAQDVRVDRNGPIWVFTRANLTHLTSSPPICDPTDQDYICNGSHSNSLPHDVIKEFGAEYIIALNTVGGKLGGNMDSRADPNISVLRFLKNAMWSVISHFGLANPSFETVFEQLALTQTKMYAEGAEIISNLKHVVYVRPPVEHIPSKTWSNLPCLHRIGYFYMKAILDRNPYREDIPFFMFWTKIKDTSTELVKEGGRDLVIVH